MKKYPNVLIINNQSINSNNATGITLRSILGAWPTCNLHEMHMDKDYTFCQEKGNNNSSYIVAAVPFYNLMRKIHMLLNHKSQMNGANQSNKAEKASNDFGEMRDILNMIADVSPVFFRIDWNKYLNGFVPDVIYTCGGSVSVMKIALKAARRYQVPIVLHFMDDWAHFLQNEQGLIRLIYKKILHKWLKRCYAKSIINFTISPYMAKDYENESKIPHIALMNAVSVEKFKNEPKKQREPHIFTYTGGLHLERWKALKEIEEILREFNEKGYSFKLRIYTNLRNNPQVQCFDHTITEIYDAVAHEEINRIMEEADVLVHTETQNFALMGFFRYSISTKIPEYMATNRPILFFGPKQMKLFQHMKEHEMAFVAGSKEELKECITEMLEDNEKMERVKNNAFNYVKEKHEIKKVQETYYLTICKILDLKI